MTEKRFLTLLKTQVVSQKPCFPLRALLIGITDMYEKFGFEIELTRFKKTDNGKFSGKNQIQPRLRSSSITPDILCH